MEFLSTLYDDYQQLILDINIYKRFKSIPSKTLEEMRQDFYKEFKLVRPYPTFEDNRYKLSSLVSDDFEIAYNKELALQDNEELIDFGAGEHITEDKDLSSLEIVNIAEDFKKLFKYENSVTDKVRDELVEKYNIDSDELGTDIKNVEEVFNTVKSDKSLILSDTEIENLGESNSQTIEAHFEDGEVPHFDDGEVNPSNVDMSISLFDPNDIADIVDSNVPVVNNSEVEKSENNMFESDTNEEYSETDEYTTNEEELEEYSDSEMDTEEYSDDYSDSEETSEYSDYDSDEYSDSEEVEDIIETTPEIVQTPEVVSNENIEQPTEDIEEYSNEVEEDEYDSDDEYNSDEGEYESYDEYSETDEYSDDVSSEEISEVNNSVNETATTESVIVEKIESVSESVTSVESVSDEYDSDEYSSDVDEYSSDVDEYSSDVDEYSSDVDEYNSDDEYTSFVEEQSEYGEEDEYTSDEVDAVVEQVPPVVKEIKKETTQFNTDESDAHRQKAIKRVHSARENLPKHKKKSDNTKAQEPKNDISVDLDDIDLGFIPEKKPVKKKVKIDVDDTSLGIKLPDAKTIEKEVNKLKEEKTVEEKKPRQDRLPSPDEVPTDLRQFLRKYPRSEISFVEKYFTKKQISDAIKLGKIILREGILRC